MSKLQEEVVAAAKACTSEASLRKALQDLTGTAVPGGPTGPGSSPKVHESHSHGILSNLGESLEELGHKAKEALQKWHFLDGWTHDRSQDYMPDDVLEVLRTLREGEGVFGMDIGGTLAKAAQLLKPGEAHLSPSTFGKTGTFHQELSFQLKVKEEMVLKSLQNLDPKGEGPSSAPGAMSRRIVTAGGGAHRLAKLFMDSLTVEVVPFKEMESLVSGLTFLHENKPKDEVFQIMPDGSQVMVDWPDPLYPCIIVNIGSGVSVLRLDAGESGEPYFTRLGGTATGGAAFLGLVRMMTSAKTYPDCLALAQKGDATRVNKLVSDIYGQDGCGNLGLPPGLTAAHFAKITMKDFDHPAYQEADVAAAVLTMVVSASTVIARAFSRSVAEHGSEKKKPAQEREGQKGWGRQEARARSLSGDSSQPLVSKAQLKGAAPYPGERKTPVFFVGGFLAENRRAWEIISRSFRNLDCGPALFLRHADFLGVFGEIALMSEDCKRKGRCTALKRTELLILHRDDYKWCVGASQETTVKERVAFLRMAEEGLLEDMREVDLQAMASSLTEDTYIGEHEIIRQGSEVERIIFVKSGFCKIVREIHPKFTKVFCRYANYAEPMPNPYAEGEEGLRVGEKGVWPRPKPQKPTPVAEPKTGCQMARKTLKLESHQMLKNMLRLVQGDEASHQMSLLKTMEKRTRTEILSNDEAPPEKGRSLRVVVDVISKGSSVGVMELMEGLTYQCSVICSPLAEIYSISRFDFIRNGPRPITHRLFCNYKARLSDKQLIFRLVQKHRWDHYKRGLLEEIRSWNSSASRGIVDREDPVPMIGGSALEDETLMRIGRGEKLWDQRAQTPPNQSYNPDQAVKQIFKVECTRDSDGKPLVHVEREQRDASMDEFERKLLETMANARYRDKLRRAKRQVAVGASQAGQPPVEDAKGVNAVAVAQALEEEAKRSLEEQKQQEKERFQALRQQMQDKVKQDRDQSTERRPRKTLMGSSIKASASGSQSARSKTSPRMTLKNVPNLPPLSSRQGSKQR
ncbi:unnamed protein product [Durusdinium trenchii]|uniref:Cyclic nucleotide-binding domain-containing protein n=1 Tax=Durusdinium trenchii TaxID=1381693 RepID=A0ABP0P5A9_9DINO